MAVKVSGTDKTTLCEHHCEQSHRRNQPVSEIPGERLEDELCTRPEEQLYRGIQGGYYLLRPLDQITLLEVINIMELSSKWNRCLEEDSFCNNNAVMSCPIRKYYARLQEELEKKIV